jgi:hypothetical protein
MITYQFFGLFSTALHAWIFGKHVMKNMNYIPANWYTLEEIGMWVYTYLVLTIYVVYSDITEEYFGTIIAASTVMVLRIVLLSIKYGLYSKSKFKEFRSKEIPWSRIFHELLITAWLVVPHDVL